ncbi:MAG: macro domain-containing protein [Capsulimonas sp.]|uniref:type II toxin-antitoxin system antitoxin DNA ADP-ribosyl glycohydrolase DarG n=1 Tax=Capsulimonas sp. TaxID=2494211 RepID=UPI003267AA64
MPANIISTKGNLLEADVEALVNTVNTVGVMGKGIALQFRQTFPENFVAYKAACKYGSLEPGAMFVTETHLLTNPHYIINFPTKRDWRAKSKIEDIDAGLAALVSTVRELGIRSIAVPPLGCGNGGLEWDEVRPKIEAAFANLPEVHVLLYGPEGAPAADKIKIATKRPKMTPTRAAFVGMLDGYMIPGYNITILEIQKLAYFLQAAGEPMKLPFVKAQRGPYAETIHPVLQRLEGHFLRGYGDRSRDISLHVLPDAVRESNLFLEDHPETRTRIARVFELVDGFETEYSLELLATVHWLAWNEDEKIRRDPAAAVRGVQAWSERKAGLFPAEHIEIAWKRLQEQQWI